MGCHFLLQGIFLTQIANPGLLHCRLILYWLSYEFSNKVFLAYLTFLSAVFDTLHFRLFSQRNTLFSAWALVAHTRSILHWDTLLTVLALWHHTRLPLHTLHTPSGSDAQHWVTPFTGYSLHTMQVLTRPTRSSAFLGPDLPFSHHRHLLFSARIMI